MVLRLGPVGTAGDTAVIPAAVNVWRGFGMGGGSGGDAESAEVMGFGGGGDLIPQKAAGQIKKLLD
ncbi:MAG: hypothetical protein QF719_11400 [Chloroflexota bacterium]|nr:hypothetical protein [Chloroflexota bacterium]MDP6508269.1 hypothetical protein [Chloroflexota bacterium]MDP6758785.1 hypothetical protein [Chloroflexota bacterium]